MTIVYLSNDFRMTQHSNIVETSSKQLRDIRDKRDQNHQKEYENYANYTQNHSKIFAASPISHQNKPIMKDKQRRIVIVTNYRSGSSFIGELLKAHPGMFYAFEPLWFATGGYTPMMTPQGVAKTKTLNTTADYLDALLFHCNVTAFERDYRARNKSNRTWINRVFPGSGSFQQAKAKCEWKPYIATKVCITTFFLIYNHLRKRATPRMALQRQKHSIQRLIIWRSYCFVVM